MNVPKERLEKKTNRVLIALEELAALSKYGDEIKSRDLLKVQAALELKLDDALTALKSGRDAIQFSLNDTNP